MACLDQQPMVKFGCLIETTHNIFHCQSMNYVRFFFFQFWFRKEQQIFEKDFSLAYRLLMFYYYYRNLDGCSINLCFRLCKCWINCSLVQGNLAFFVNTKLLPLSLIAIIK
jgi:hypothetical protein